MYFPKLEDIKKAAETLQGVSAITPCHQLHSASAEHEAKIWVKREDLQSVRSYKIRGAYNKIQSLSDTERQKGVVCASAGNHAQGVAFSCAKLHINGRIYMPSTTPSQKIEQVKMFGGDWIDVILIGDTFDEANDAAKKDSLANKAVYIAPFDDPKVIEGQATIGLEILNQCSFPIDYLLLPIGGGGVAAGVSSLFSYLSPNTKVIGVEPSGAASMTEALKQKHPVKLELIEKFVDGAAVQQVGSLNFEVCQKNLDRVLLVEEGKLCRSILKLYNKDAIVVEPAGALTLSALDLIQEEIKGKNVVCLISGGNNDITRMEEIKEKALIHEGKKHYFIVNFPQRAGALKDFLTNVLGPNDDISHFEYTKKHARNTGAAVIGIELKDPKDLAPLIKRMKSGGFYDTYINDEPVLFNLLT